MIIPSRLHRGIIAFGGALLLAAITFNLGMAVDWGPSPAIKRGVERQRRDMIPGQRLEMGEVIEVQGTATLLRGGEAEKEGERALPQTQGRGKLEIADELRVGDTIQMGDEIRTGKGANIEVLFGINGRVRLGESSKIRMVKIVEVPGGKRMVERRRVVLDYGLLRIRVRKNTVRPSPVLVVGVGADITIGRNELNVPGGVDALIKRVRGNGHDRPSSSSVVVLNGTVRLSRQGTIERAPDSVDLGRGRRMIIPKEEAPLPSLAEVPILNGKDIYRFKRNFAYSNEKFDRENMIPERRSGELDGP